MSTGTSDIETNSQNYYVSGTKVLDRRRNLKNISNISANGKIVTQSDLVVYGNILDQNGSSIIPTNILSGGIVGVGHVGYGIGGTLTSSQESSPTSYSGTSLFIGPFSEPLGGSITVTEEVKALIILETTVYNRNSGDLLFKFTGDTGTDNNTTVGDIQYGLTQRPWKTANSGPFTLEPKFVAGASGWDGYAVLEGTVYLYK